MFILKKDIIPGTVVWAEKDIYYDQPDKKISGKRSMFLVTMINTDYFFGCPLTVNTSAKNQTVLSTKFYPVKKDSRVTECLYKIPYTNIANSKTFKVSDGTFKHFKRNLYKKIILGFADSPDEYNELFVNEFLKNNIPSIDDIIVYPSDDKVLKYYYIYDLDEETYSLLRLKKDGYNYSLNSNCIEFIPKSIRFFDYFTNHNMHRPSSDEIKVEGVQKRIGTLK